MYTTKNIALISIATSLLVAVKYLLGFVPGIELVTFLIILYGVFFPILVSSSITLSFILLTGVIYGMGYWWIMYWFIFFTETILSWIFRKTLKKNNIIFGVWTGFWGFSIIFWYALQDWLMQGPGLAIANMSTGLITNVVEGVSNALVGIFMFYPAKSFFDFYFKNQYAVFW